MLDFETALVTGSTGFIGASLVKDLLNRGKEVICPVRPNSPGLKRLESHPSLTLIPIEKMDAPSIEKALENHRAEVVFHLASYGVRPTDRDPSEILTGNVGLVDALLRVTAPWHLTRFIHVGTFSEYAPIGSDEACIPFTEDHPLRPDSLYGAGKASAGIWGHALASRLGTRFIALRMFHVYGPGEAEHRLLPFIIDRLKNENPVDLSPGDQVRDLIFIDDAVNAIISAAIAPELREPTYNISTGVGVSIREMGEMAASLMGKSSSLLKWGGRDYRPGEAMWMVGNNERFVRDTRWHAQTDLKTGIQRTIDARLSGN